MTHNRQISLLGITQTPCCVSHGGAKSKDLMEANVTMLLVDPVSIKKSVFLSDSLMTLATFSPGGSSAFICWTVSPFHSSVLVVWKIVLG